MSDGFKAAETDKLSSKFILDAVLQKEARKLMTQEESASAAPEPKLQAAPDEIPAAPDVVLPAQKYFRMRDLVRITGLDPQRIRAWEKEIKSIRPQRSRSGQRVYRRKDAQIVLRLAHWIANEGLSIEEAKEMLRTGSRPLPLSHADVPAAVLDVTSEGAECPPTPVLVTMPDPVSLRKNPEAPEHQAASNDHRVLNDLAEELKQLIALIKQDPAPSL